MLVVTLVATHTTFFGKYLPNTEGKNTVASHKKQAFPFQVCIYHTELHRTTLLGAAHTSQEQDYSLPKEYHVMCRKQSFMLLYKREQGELVWASFVEYTQQSLPLFNRERILPLS